MGKASKKKKSIKNDSLKVFTKAKNKKSTHKQKVVESAVNQLERHVQSLHAGWWDV